MQVQDFYYDIAYAALTNRLVLFTGTGFSKAVTNDRALSWIDLLIEVIDQSGISDKEKLKDFLFPMSIDNKRKISSECIASLEEAAQMINIKLKKIDEDIALIIRTIIESIKLAENNDIVFIKNFIEAVRSRSLNLKVVTTNYDGLFEDLLNGNIINSIVPGLPIPKVKSNFEIYHVHGSIDSPENMIITSEDYFDFINSETYFSRKLSTLLYENTVVILGYSLSDLNLKAIICEQKKQTKNYLAGANILFISRDSIHPDIKDYYGDCYGIRVLDNIEILDFFQYLTNKILNDNWDHIKISLENIQVFASKEEEEIFNPDFIRQSYSFFHIMSAIEATGWNLNNAGACNLLVKAMKQKIKLTGDSGAWKQYQHLANWLIYIASKFDIQGTEFESEFLSFVIYSMTNMGRYIGYSWEAYDTWKNYWGNILVSNKNLIRNYWNSIGISWEPALEVIYQ
ncbi:MAG: SIR2 family protein [Candidatus Caenarcaniphilales bacterium]|nr:SIR2 family protein [Candidatus Caenarcaniphilales bacterium]